MARRVSRGKPFSSDYEAGDILGLYHSKLTEGDELRLRTLAIQLRAHTRMQHNVTIPDVYKAITRDVRTPYMRDAWARISASLVSKPPIVQVQPKDDQKRDYRDAAADASRFDSALIDRLNKETGEDAVYGDTAALVRDGESVLKVVHRPDAWANFPGADGVDAGTALERQTEYKRGADLPIAWRNVDRLSCLFSDGEYGDEWVVEYGEYPLPYLKRRFGLVELGGELAVPEDVLGGRPKPEGWLQATVPGRAIKVEFFDEREWHVIVNGIEPKGWPRKNPYAPHLPYFRAKAYDSESLLYSLLWLVPRLDELLTMKLNWAYLGSYPNPMIKTVPNSAALPGLDGPLGDPQFPEAGPRWAPGKLIELPLGKEMSFLVPPPIGADTNELLQILRGLVEVAGIPSVMRGSAASGDSGYLANQMMSAASMQYRLASLTLQRQHERALDFVHWLVSNVIKQTIWVQGWEDLDARSGRPKSRAGRAWLGLSPDQQGKNLAPVSKLGPVTFQFRPTLPTDEQARAMVAIQATNAPKPLFGRRHALEMWMEEEDPDRILDELWVEQAMEEEPLRSMVVDSALRDAGLAMQPQQGAPQPGPNGQMIPPGPNGLSPIAPGQVAAGMPSVPGLNMPIQPAPPGIMPGNGGRPAGAYPGQPPNQGPPIP